MPGSLIVAASVYVLAVNALTFVAFWWDKRCARRGDWRVSERSLLTLAALGGSPGAFAGRRLLRHKTTKEPFRTRLVIVATIQVGLGIACCALYAGGLQGMVS